jgi:hypothetical protein
MAIVATFKLEFAIRPVAVAQVSQFNVSCAA